ncbi:MAG: thioredoxin [Chitinivibrionales bacterium]|nr:thioredoxin [Chitinivibrionales bacterium]MBD3359051.1 thioredoxin [Chitinivibrionales bacterium]
MVTDVTDFSIEVLERSHSIPVLVDFWAPWCGPCRTLGPILEGLARRHESEWELAKVNIDENQELAMKYGVMGIPAVKLFVDGKERDGFTGTKPAQAIEQWLSKTLPTPFDSALAEARKLLDQRQPELAEAMLANILKQDPGNRRAKVMRAQILVFSEPEQAVGLVSDVREGDVEFEIADAVHSLAKLFMQSATPAQMHDSPAKRNCLNAVDALGKGDFDAALTEFIAAMKADRGFYDEYAGKACVAILKYLGDNSEITKKHQRGFGTARDV